MTGSRPTGWEGAERWFSSGGGGGGGDDPADRPAPGGEGGPDGVPPPLVCEVCGAELEPDQTYCLECGSPTPLAPRLRRSGRTVAVLAGAMIVLGLGAGALAYAVVEDDDTTTVVSPTTAFTSPGGLPIAPTGSIPAVPLPPETAPTTGTLPADTSVTTPTTPTFTTSPPGTTGFDTVTGPSGVPTTAPTTTAAPTTQSSPPTTTGSAPTGASDWPTGTSAWTAVLSSVRSEPDARAAKGRIAKGGDPAGVLLSSDFPDLRPGYWVVFSGMYDSRSTAIAQAVKLRPDFPTAYARRIEG